MCRQLKSGGMEIMMEKKKTIYDIAAQAGVSPASVSRAIHQPELVSETTKQKIWDAFRELKLSKQDLSFKSTPRKTILAPRVHAPTVLVCIPGFLNPFYDSILEGIDEQLRWASCHMLVYGQPLSRSNVSKILALISSIGADGVILMEQQQEDILQRLHAACPLIQCSEYNPACPNISYVTVDDYTTSEEAIRYLIGRGCKNIGFFSTPYRNRYVQTRYRAYKSVLTEEGLAIRPEYIRQVSDFSYERILSAAAGFFEMPDMPDAIFAVSDKHAHALIKAAVMRGLRIPDDIKVIGVDNTMYSTLSTPTITTIAQPRRELGSECAKIMLDIIKQPDGMAVKKVLPSEMIFRESA